MVAWQIERGAGGCLRLEELKNIVSVLSAFSWSLFSVIQSFMSDMQINHADNDLRGSGGQCGQ